MKEIFKTSKNYFVSSLIMFVVCIIANQFLPYGVMELLIELAIGGVVYVACLILLKDEFVLEVLKRIKDKVGRNLV